MRNPEKRWVQLPAKAQIRDGTLIEDADGRVAYTPAISFTRRAVADAFSARAVDAILDAFPSAFKPQRAAS